MKVTKTDTFLYFKRTDRDRLVVPTELSFKKVKLSEKNEVNNLFWKFFITDILQTN